MQPHELRTNTSEVPYSRGNFDTLNLLENGKKHNTVRLEESKRKSLICKESATRIQLIVSSSAKSTQCVFLPPSKEIRTNDWNPFASCSTFDDFFSFVDVYLLRCRVCVLSPRRINSTS